MYAAPGKGPLYEYESLVLSQVSRGLLAAILLGYRSYIAFLPSYIVHILIG